MVADSGVTPRNRWNDAETTASTHDWEHGGEPHPHMVTIRRVAASRRHAWSCYGRAAPWPWRCRTWTAVGGLRYGHGRMRNDFLTSGKWSPVHGARAFVRRPLPPWPQLDSNKGASESLSELGGKGIRVRPESPSKATKNGSQTVPSPIGLVGANGKACGEAPACLFSGTPPCVVAALPFDIGNRYRFRV